MRIRKLKVLIYVDWKWIKESMCSHLWSVSANTTGVQFHRTVLYSNRGSWPPQTAYACSSET